MNTRFRPYHPEQTYLLPPSPSDWLAEGHLGYFIAEIVDTLDVDSFYARYEGDREAQQSVRSQDAVEGAGVPLRKRDVQFTGLPRSWKRMWRFAFWVRGTFPIIAR
jgi:hypothetical protein